MSSAKSVVEAAVFAALVAKVSGATVYQDAPENAEGDLVIIGDMKSARLPGKEANPDRTVTLSVVAIVNAEERAPLLALQEQCDAALDGTDLDVPGWVIRGQFDDDDAVLSDDGASYTGVSSYTFLALAD